MNNRRRNRVAAAAPTMVAPMMIQTTARPMVRRRRLNSSSGWEDGSVRALVEEWWVWLVSGEGRVVMGVDLEVLVDGPEGWDCAQAPAHGMARRIMIRVVSNSCIRKGYV